MEKTISYDVFISYRRKTGANDARLLEQALKTRGFNVFFDYSSLRYGNFDSYIFSAIKQAPVVILIITSDSLNECINEDDWVRKEIEYALSFKDKRIIPVAPSDQRCSFPSKMPNSIKELKWIQISELNKASLFDASIDKIIEDRFPESLKAKAIHAQSNDYVFNNLIDKTFEAMMDFSNAVTNNYPQEKFAKASGKLTKCMKDIFMFYQKYQFSDKILSSKAQRIVDEYNAFIDNFRKFISYPIEERQESNDAKQYAEQSNKKFNNLINYINSVRQQNENK